MVDRMNHYRNSNRRNHCGRPDRNGSGSGNHFSSVNKDPALLKKLQSLDFSLTETILYLDAYPDSTEALAYYQKLLNERSAVIATLAGNYHMPITGFDNVNTDTWDWINGPWPWEVAAN